MTYNQGLAIILCGVAAVACAIAGVLVFAFPEEAVKHFNTAWVRVLLLLVCALQFAIIAVELYNLFYDKPAHRMYMHLIRYVSFVGVTGSAAPLAFFGLQHVQAFGATISFQQAGISSAIAMSATFTALCFLGCKYQECVPVRTN